MGFQEERVCPACGKTFIANIWNKIYCSAECHNSIPLDHRIKPQRKKKKARVHHLSYDPDTPQRHCHDCGKPTNDYRCEACWKKLRGWDTALDDSEESSAVHL